ncbi:MAG TPA: hypothetical protein PK951_06215 [Chitinophagaceae bacterium]|nr:hypothetical protein [Chitinophagaceae bacterium]HUM65879.1 hypothetical protein [Chitinophagaceae bacterium]
MKKKYSISKRSIRRLIILALLASSTVGTFAMLGTPGKGRKGTTKSLLSSKKTTYTGSFSLRSGYDFRGSQVINTQQSKYLNVNTMVSYQRGHTTYAVPLKKKVVLNGKLTFNPNAATR